MSLERKYLLARMVEGEAIVSRRVVPFPHKFYLADEFEIEEFVVGRLVEQGIVAPKPEDALWDRIGYPVASVFALETQAREYWPNGFGRCSRCRTILGAGLRSNSTSEQDFAATAPRSRTSQQQHLGTARIRRTTFRPATARASRSRASSCSRQRSSQCRITPARLRRTWPGANARARRIATVQALARTGAVKSCSSRICAARFTATTSTARTRAMTNRASSSKTGTGTLDRRPSQPEHIRFIMGRVLQIIFVRQSFERAAVRRVFPVDPQHGSVS